MIAASSVRVVMIVGMLALGGCTEWTIPACEGTPFKTPVSDRVPWRLSQSGRTIPV